MWIKILCTSVFIMVMLIAWANLDQRPVSSLPRWFGATIAVIILAGTAAIVVSVFGLIWA